MWKRIELSLLDKYCQRKYIFWKAHAPESVLNKLASTLLAVSMRTWYIFRENAVKKEFGIRFSAIGSIQSIWLNRNLRSKSKKFFLYEDWLDNGIIYISDLLNPPFPGSKLFEELVLDFHIDIKDRRKYNFLMKCIPPEWLVTSEYTHDVVFDRLIENIRKANKITKYAYDIMMEECTPENRVASWNNSFNLNYDYDRWNKIHLVNFRCSIFTRLRAFYFKLFYRAIALNKFLHKIKKKDSPLCSLCNNEPETYLHIFVECDVVKPLWDQTLNTINDKNHQVLNVSNFEKMFGLCEDKFVTYIFLIFKYYIYVCKFQKKIPDFQGFRNYLNMNKDTEYRVAKRKGKLHVRLHFAKWRFDL